MYPYEQPQIISASRWITKSLVEIGGDRPKEDNDPDGDKIFF